MSSCTHPDMMKQEGFLNFVQNMVVTGVQAPARQLKILDVAMEEKLQEDLDKCSHIFEASRDTFKNHNFVI